MLEHVSLQSRQYWFHTYFNIDLAQSVTEHRAYLRSRVEAFRATRGHLAITDVAIWPSPGAFGNYRNLKCADAWLRVGQACAAEGLYYWLPLAGSGSTAHYFPPEVLDVIRGDALAWRHMLGLFLFEQPTPSLVRGDHFDLAYWFTDKQLQIPTRLYDLPQDHWTLPHGAQLAREFDPQAGAIVEPLKKPIENPIEALAVAREAYKRWGQAYLDRLDSHQSLNLLSWVSSNRWFHCGFDATKQAMALQPFDRLNVMVEVNNDDMSVAYAQARGISRATRGLPWGAMVGGVRWKYWNEYLKATGRAHASDSGAYGKSPDVPPWMFFVPMAVAWAGGARQISYEADPEQVRAPQIRAALDSFYDLVESAGEPMNPQVNLALLKGNGYFAWDIPGFDGNGMREEINSHARYYNGRNVGDPGCFAQPITELFYPRIANTREWYDTILSGNPNGEIDILPPGARGRSLHCYRTIVLYEWNCLDEATHKKLLDYARGGGTLFIAAGQMFSQADGRINWQDPPAEAFYNNGNLRDLAGLHLTGGSTTIKNASIRSRGKDRFFPPELEYRSDGVRIYRSRLAGATPVLAIKGQTLCARKRIGKGWVYTFCGPSYYAALEQAMPKVFKQIARENRQHLPYRITNISEDEEKDLALFCDDSGARVAMVNYWDRHNMAPRVALTGVAGQRRGQRILVHDCAGLVTDLTLPPSKIPRDGAAVTVLSQSVALLTYAQTPANSFALTHVVRDYGMLAHADITLTYGPVSIALTKARSPHWPEKQRAIQVSVGGLQGRWKVSVKVGDRVGRAVVAAVGGMLSLRADLIGPVESGARIEIRGRRA